MQGYSPKYQHHGQRVEEPQSVPNQLWISGQHFAHNPHALAQHNIQAVCSLGSDSFTFPSNIKHLYLQVEDTPDQDITGIFDKVYNFIQQQRLGSNVLVHCAAGVSRSAAVVAYYLMKKYRWGLEESLMRIREARPFARPNEGFWRQLREAEAVLNLRIVRGRF